MLCGVDPRPNLALIGPWPSLVSRIFKSLARSAELNDEVIKGISGHSMRVGAAQDLLMNGASLPQIMVKGGWSKTDTVMRYIDKVRPNLQC